MKSFKTWIKEYKKENSAIGDLARDIYEDKVFPATKDFVKMLDYLTYSGACIKCINTYVKAYKLYIDYLAEAGNELQ